MLEVSHVISNYILIIMIIISAAFSQFLINYFPCLGCNVTKLQRARQQPVILHVRVMSRCSAGRGIYHVDKELKTQQRRDIN